MRLEAGKAIIPSVIKAVEVARELGILVVWVTALSFAFSSALFVFWENILQKNIFSGKYIDISSLTNGPYIYIYIYISSLTRKLCLYFISREVFQLIKHADGEWLVVFVGSLQKLF